MLVQIALAIFCSLASTGFAWPDCSAASVKELGSAGNVSTFNASAEDGTLLFVVHPALSGHLAPYPVMVFSHGTTAELAMYEHALEHYASHGFVIIFPHIKSPEADIHPWVLDPKGDFAIKGVHFAVSANVDKTSVLHQQLDLSNLVLVGHSMGASTTIMAAKRLPAGTAKLAIAQHPGICGPFGPPPSPNTWMPADFHEAAEKLPMLLTTATNDGAFWPAPLTAQHEYGCFNKSTMDATAAGTAFLQFSADVCQDDQTGGRPGRNWSTGGHDCPMRLQSPETPWVLVAAKLYAQLGGDDSSSCFRMLWGDGDDSLRADKALEKYVVNAPGRATAELLLAV
eukprot:TRINITY_DN47448_c0_g1_i1.p1 TRINITY_DN47448_c0_g1~~TRINITY_DN47448_c0_g1_i1.p1  ORF type:complete len:341 (+),score=86.70 TRINITY_DN47448_c0_g1_i1:64-1086(+)